MSKSEEKPEDTQSLSDAATDCDSARQSPSQHGNSKGKYFHGTASRDIKFVFFFKFELCLSNSNFIRTLFTSMVQ